MVRIMCKKELSTLYNKFSYLANSLSFKNVFLMVGMLYFSLNLFGAEYEDVIYEMINKPTQKVNKKEPLFPFRIGIELQENHRLFPWGLDDNRLQKKPVFSVYQKASNSELFHVEIDTDDLEFVTPPFSYKEKDLFFQSMITIHKAVDILGSSSNFYSWVKKLEGIEEIYLKQHQLFNQIKLYAFQFHGKWNPSPDKWKPSFAPQVTIQHKLAATIPLYFSLFGFSGINILPFKASVPCRDLYLKVFADPCREDLPMLAQQYTTPISGLTFLNALTLVCLTPADSTISDELLLEETLVAFLQTCQVDAKMRLSLLSRRPFSEMLRDIPRNNETDYTNFFYYSMTHKDNGNNQFGEFFNVPNDLKKINYGEQFFDDNGKPLSLV